ncbi:uncharacterized protein LOC143084815 isoform X2 [Mytilus galloprovincialis]|uniref:uncharacterized protein LOC143084815 isoform X2 n=1 Tax=Mytilus galloprovincialis TaxID=29158 RepID=UPI003F7C24F5
MGTMILQSQIGALENGLKDLRKSRLMQIREFKDMYGAIECHHRDLRLAHLTGKAKDLMVQAEQDTRFFHILIKMMCEVKQTSSMKQKDSLIKVHHWYTSNKHILHTAPRFGKQRKDSASSKTAAPRAKTASAKRTKSTKTHAPPKQQEVETTTVRLASADGSKNRIFCETPSIRTESPYKTGTFDLDLLPSNQDYVNDYLSTNYLPDGDNNKMSSLQHFLNDLPGPSDTGSHLAGQHFQIHKSPGSLGDSGDTPPGSPREDIDGSAVSPNYIDSLINYSHKNEDDDEGPEFEVEVTIGPDDSDMHESRRKLSRGRTPSASFRRDQVLSDQSSNISIALPKKMIHPIASLVNPHATLAAAEAKRAEEEYLNSRQDVYTPLRPSRHTSAQIRSHMTTPVGGRPLSNTRAENLNQWKHFNQDFSYGQDILGKLNFVGRSGTALDVRYSSHGHGESPENTTPYVLAYLANQSLVMQSAPIQVDKENRLLNRPLEEFYEMAEDYCPSKLPKCHHPVVSKPPTQPKSAPPKSSRSDGTSKSARTHQLGRNLLEKDDKKSEVKDNDNRSRSEVKLDVVVNMIESVSEDMVHFKEKLAPQPVAGFRQPASTGVSMKPLSRPATASGIRSPSPMMRTNSPVGNHDNLARSQSSPYLSEDILINEDTSKSARSLPSNRVVQAIDWRGKIAPDSVRYKWQKTQFGGHTYVKKMPKGKRPVGATHAGNRPKTAPVTAREKWKTDKPSDHNTRVEGQAATNTMTQVDQNVVDSMMVVNHILGSSDSSLQRYFKGSGSFNSLYLDENFLKTFNSRVMSASGTTNTNTPVPMEYVPIVANAPRSLPGLLGYEKLWESRTQSRLTRKSERSDSRIQELLPEDELDDYVTEKQEAEEVYSQTGIVTTTPVEQDKPTDEEVELQEQDAELVETVEKQSESVDNLTDTVNKQTESEEEEVETAEKGTVTEETEQNVTHRSPHIIHPVHFSQDLHNGDVHLEVLAIPSGGRLPSAHPEKHGTIQELSASESWNFCPDGEIVDVKEKKKAYSRLSHRDGHWFKEIVKPENYCFECIPDSMSTKVGRQAGRMPNGTQSASSQVLRMSRKQTEYFKHAPPLRTPPSIPSASHRQSQFIDQSPRYGQTYSSEIEHHARSTRSPRHYMEQVVDLRTNGIRSAPPGSHSGLDGSLSSSLHVSRLSSRQNTMIETSRSGIEHEKTIYPNNAHIEIAADGTRHVVFNDEKLESVAESGVVNGHGEEAQDRFKSATTQKSRRSNQSISRVGRPIAHYYNIKDPYETAAAFKLQKEAEAAVDIQRIFRGFVARNMYKKLIKEEREILEDQRKAAIEIQRVYRGHLIRKTKILNRPPVSNESLEWARELKIVQAEKAQKRQNKMEALSNLNTLNHQSSSSKLSTIGPHVEIYQIYHPKLTGPTKKELYDAATSIQKNVRRFLVRCRFDRLYRKAVWYGSTWPKMVKDYKNSLKRCQHRHGVDRAKTPFTIEYMNDYMESRRRFESVFDKKAFAGEMEFSELDQFFRESDLYPSQSEIEEAVDVVFQGQASSKKGLRKSDLLELVWYIYVPKAAGLPNMRQSTWLNPIIDGVEARKLIAGKPSKKGAFTRSEYVEKAPLEVCAKLVIDSKRERREKEKLENLKRQDEDAAKLKRDLSAFQYEEEDENEGIKGELARTRERLSSTKSKEDSQN